MSAPEQWTSGEIAGRLENLFEAFDTRQLESFAEVAYLDAAAVLTAFDPDTLQPVVEIGDGPPPARQVLGEVELASISTENQWVLAPDLRKEHLRRLVEMNLVEPALAANPDRPMDLLQKTLERNLRRQSTPLEEQTVPELQASLQVRNWLAGIVPGPSPEELRQRIELETFLKPFHDLVGERFAGRDEQMETLSRYVGVFGSSPTIVDRIRNYWQRPLMIEAPGGMGKSTLIAEFILIHSAAQHVRRFPFAYLDFDRPGLIAEEPVTLLLEAIRQFGVQFPEAAARAAEVRDEWQKKAREAGASQRVSAGVARFVKFSDSDWFYRSFAEFVAAVCPPGAPVLLVLDTFEEVQYRSKTFVIGVFLFLQEMQARIPQLRTVIAGRAGVQLDAFPVQLLKLPPFDRAAAQAFLEKQGVTDVALGFAIADQVGGSPMTLKLAAQLVAIEAAEAGPEGIRNLDTGVLARVLGKSIEAQLYNRILDHIHDKDVQKLAHPGLILRKITEGLIQEVLAGVCGVDVSRPGRAAELFAMLSEEIALVETGERGVLVHRPDVRAVTLRMLIEDRKMRAQAEQINAGAIRYYAGMEGSEARAEEVYHLLLFGLDRERVEPRAGDVTALGLVTRSIDELPERSQAFLAARVQIERPDRIWELADLPDWELYAARVVSENLAMGKTAAAMAVLRQRGERTGSSPLFRLEVEALAKSGEYAAAEELAAGVLTQGGMRAGAELDQLTALRYRLESRRAVRSLPMVECPATESPVRYQDRDEHHGEWVATRGAHTIDVAQSFFLSPVLVTNELFARFVRDGGYARDEFWDVSREVRDGFLNADGTPGPGGWPSAAGYAEGTGQHPVCSISFREATAFVAWLNAVDPDFGWRWALPGEDEWEWAARGTQALQYPWGMTFAEGRCNSKEAGMGGTTAVGMFRSGSSWVGCHDMAGNVWEFVQGSGGRQGSVLRGGSFLNTGAEVKSSLRLFGVPNRHRPPDFGMRLARVRAGETKR